MIRKEIVMLLGTIIEAASFVGAIGGLIAEILGISVAVGTLVGIGIGGYVGIVTGIAEQEANLYYGYRW